MSFLKSILFLGSLRLAASLAPGDCAFVGVYGDDDDFALVLLEDANGESIQLTEELPQNGYLEVKKSAAAKDKVSDAKRGTVLKKDDFQVDSMFVAPLGLTAFTGSSESPTVLCSINLDQKRTVRKLEESFTVMLGLTESAEYAGATSGSKDQLLADIMDTHNWRRGVGRRLNGFSIATGSNATTVTMTTTMTVTVAEGTETKVEGCMEVTVSDLSLLQGSDAAKEALRESIGEGAGVDVSYVQDLEITVGSCGVRRQRRLQSSASISFTIVFPASLGSLAPAQAAAAVASLQSVSTTDFTAAIATKIAAIPELASVLTITVSSVPTASVLSDEVGVTKSDGCMEFYTADFATLSGVSAITDQWTSVYASYFGVPEMYIDNVAMQSGSCTFSRRMAESRRLSEFGCVKWRMAYAPSRYGGVEGAYAAAQAHITSLASVNLATLSTNITTGLQTDAALVNVTVDVVAIDLQITETGVTTVTTTGGDETESHAAATSFALGLLVIFFRM